MIFQQEIIYLPGGYYKITSTFIGRMRYDQNRMIRDISEQSRENDLNGNYFENNYEVNEPIQGLDENLNGENDLDERMISYNLMIERMNLSPAEGTRQKYCHPSRNCFQKNLFQI